MKYVVIGASPYDVLPAFLEDLRNAKQAPDALVLAEGNPQLLQLMVPLAQRLLRDAGKATRVEGTQDPLPALAEADMVLVSGQGDGVRWAADIASLATVLHEPVAQNAMAALLRQLRTGAVLRLLWERLRQEAPQARMLLSLPDADALVHAVLAFGKVPCLGLDIPTAERLSEQRQYQTLARLAKVQLEGLSTEGDAAWREALSGVANPLMRLALSWSGLEDAVEAPSLCFPNGEAYPMLPAELVLSLPARVDAAGATPYPREELTPELEEHLFTQYPFQHNIARAAALGDRGALREVIEEHPALYGADRLLVFDLLLSLIDAQADLLPQF